jgi:alkylhydroperoxidase/carboxymuconolactone decarboxylase family protein YurZ
MDMKLFKSNVFLIPFALLLGFAGNMKAQSKADGAVGLHAEQRSLISIASLTAKGDLENLETALAKGLDTGLTVNEIKEATVHLYAYCGFPRSLRGLRTFIKVLDQRKANGIEDTLGPQASPINDRRPKYERGKANLEELVNRKLDGPPTDYAQFAPVIEVFLKEHLFADIFERDVLDYAERELVTVSVLITLGGVEPMLRSHMNICLIQGITPRQLEELIGVLEKNVDSAKIISAREVLNELIKSKE